MDDDDGMKPSGPKQLPPASGQGGANPPTGSAATNGYWLHDAAGPAVLVSGQSASMQDLERALTAQAPGVRCVVESGSLCIDGTVASQAEAADIRRLAKELGPDLPIISRIAVREEVHNG